MNYEPLIKAQLKRIKDFEDYNKDLKEYNENIEKNLTGIGLQKSSGPKNLNFAPSVFIRNYCLSEYQSYQIVQHMQQEGDYAVAIIDLKDRQNDLLYYVSVLFTDQVVALASGFVAFPAEENQVELWSLEKRRRVKSF